MGSAVSTSDKTAIIDPGSMNYPAPHTFEGQLWRSRLVLQKYSDEATRMTKLREIWQLSASENPINNNRTETALLHNDE